MTDREIMQQALDAMMDAMRVSGGISDKMFESVNAISERLAQPDPLQRLTNVQQEIEAALAPEQKPVDIGTEWASCVKLPVTVHVRQQRPGETHVSTREGITPVKPDDLIMRGVSGEEYPIGREIFERTYQLGEAQTKPEQGQLEWQGLFFDAVYEAWHSAGMDVLGGDWNTFASTLEDKLKEKNT